MKKLSLLGSTGSIGQQTLEVVSLYPDQFEVVALAAGSNLALMEEQVRRFSPRLVSLETKDAADRLAFRLKDHPIPLQVEWGSQGLLAVATHPESNLILSAVVGAAGLLPTLEAIGAGKDIALANKEAMVMAGELIMGEAARKGVQILPIDSEHSAIFQCLEGRRRQDLRRVILTASGGPFRNLPQEQFSEITPERALNHPSWSMGRKITIDSSTLMNKGLEVIEAKWLFDLSIDQIDVLVHPQCAIHSMVEFVDGSVLAQLAITDMQVPILYALSYPHRLPSQRGTLDFSKLSPLTFEELDEDRFPCFSYACEAARVGGSMPTVLNAANEKAVSLFLKRKIPYTAIPLLIRRALDSHTPRPVKDLEDILEADRKVRQQMDVEYEDL
jgi:1-deoxy-D-xylulose-5-phosphate reductoisomerase